MDLPIDTRKQLIASVKRYTAENLDQEIGDQEAGLWLDYCLREIGPLVHTLEVLT